MSYITIEFIDETNKDLYSSVKNYQDDAGFDLYCPKTVTIEPNTTGNKYPLGIKAAVHDVYKNYKAYMLAPRSSMGAKTPLRLSNSIGIIDKGYRGELVALLDNNSDKPYTINSGDRLVQVVPFDGRGISHVIIGTLNETQRGKGGLGSTGR